MAIFNINIGNKPGDTFTTKNTQIFEENCNGIIKTFNVQIINNTILPENTIELLESFDSEYTWAHLNTRIIEYSNSDKFFMTINGNLMNEGATYDTNITTIDYNENVPQLQLKSNIDINDFSIYTMTLEIRFEDTENNLYEFKTLQLSITPSLCSQSSNPTVTQLDFGNSYCDSQYIAFSVENTPYSNLSMSYRTLNNGTNSYTGKLEKLNSFDGDVISETNLIHTETNNNIVHQIDETGINYYRIHICSIKRVDPEEPNKCSLIFNIYDINKLYAIYSYILTDET